VEQFGAEIASNNGGIVYLPKYQTLIRSSKNRDPTICKSIRSLGSKCRREVVSTLLYCNLTVLNVKI
jgi:hypothetical protein